MRRNEKKLVKTRTDWRRKRQMKKIKLLMTVILIAICISVAAGVISVWFQIKPYVRKNASSAVPSQDYSSNSGLPVYDDSLNLLLVNSNNQLADGYKPELADFDSVQVDKRIIPALKEMLSDAETAGCPIVLKSGYVDKAQQDKLFKSYTENLMKNKKLSEVKAESVAQSAVGKGGYNENQTGLAVTFSAADLKSGSSFSNTPQYNWLIKNCVKYGFVLRYQEDKVSYTGMEYDPCHFRYVGADNAIKMREYSMCLEEYVSYVNQQ